MALELCAAQLSGESITLKVEPHHTVADVMHQLERSFRAPILALVAESGRLSPKTRLAEVMEGPRIDTTVVKGFWQDQCYRNRRAAALRCSNGALRITGDDLSATFSEVLQVCSTRDAFAGVRANGELWTWNSLDAPELSDVQCLVATDGAFAARMRTGAVVTWGCEEKGGNCLQVRSDLVDVRQICSSRGAFAALTGSGRVVVWGQRESGGYLPSHRAARLQRVVRLVASSGAFAALTEGGTVLSWGSPQHGGELPQLTDVVEIYASYRAFAFRRSDGQVITWGGASPGGQRPFDLGARRLHGVVGSNAAFAGILEDDTVVTWGAHDECEGFDKVKHELFDVESLCSSSGAFAALRRDGAVRCWGDAALGGHGKAETATALVATLGAFAVLRSDGRVTCWGHRFSGGEPGSVAAQLTEVVLLTSSEVAFTALRADGTVLRWGHPYYTRCNLYPAE